MIELFEVIKMIVLGEQYMFQILITQLLKSGLLACLVVVDKLLIAEFVVTHIQFFALHLWNSQMKEGACWNLEH